MRLRARRQEAFIRAFSLHLQSDGCNALLACEKKGSGWAMSPKADRKRPCQMSRNVINFNAQTRIYHVLRKNITSRRKYKRGKRDGGLRRWKYLHAIRVLT
jgi:hypothetical protein